MHYYMPIQPSWSKGENCRHKNHLCVIIYDSLSGSLMFSRSKRPNTLVEKHTRPWSRRQAIYIIYYIMKSTQKWTAFGRNRRFKRWPSPESGRVFWETARIKTETGRSFDWKCTFWRPFTFRIVHNGRSTSSLASYRSLSRGRLHVRPFAFGPSFGLDSYDQLKILKSSFFKFEQRDNWWL